MLIDSHNHLGGPDREDGANQSPEEIIERMDACGVDAAVVFPFNEVDPGVSFSKANDFIASAIKRYPERLIGFARLDPNAGEDALRELERAIVELGLKGVKLHPKGQNFTLSNEYVLRIVEKAAELGVPVVFDSGKDIFDNFAIGRLAQKAPEAKIIMAHMRGEGFIEMPQRHENIYLGTVKAKVEDVTEAIKVLGAERIIAGSDSPYADMAHEMKGKFENLNLTQKEKRMIQGDTLSRILELD